MLENVSTCCIASLGKYSTLLFYIATINRALVVVVVVVVVNINHAQYNCQCEMSQRLVQRINELSDLALHLYIEPQSKTSVQKHIYISLVCSHLYPVAFFCQAHADNRITASTPADLVYNKTTVNKAMNFNT